MDFFGHLERPDLPRLEHATVVRSSGLRDRLLEGYLSRFNDRLRPLKPAALVNGMPVYDITQPPFGSRPGARVLRSGFEHVVLRREARPISMVLMLNAECDMACRHCSARFYTTDGRSPLELQEVLDLIDQFVALGGASFILSGGEPTLFPRLSEVVSHVPSDRCVAAMFTNGSRLGELAGELKGAGLFGTLVSLDSPEAEEHDAGRGFPGAFDRAVGAVERQLELGMLVGVSTYMTRQGLHSGMFDRMVELGTRLGIHQLFVFDTVPTGAFLRESGRVLSPEDRVCLRELVKKQNASPVGPAVMGQSWVNSCEGFGCFAGFYQLYVNAFGDVTPCDFTPISFGNIRDEPLEKIWARMRASELWHERFPECRMQDPEFRRTTIDLLPPGTRWPVPYEKVMELRRSLGAPKREAGGGDSGTEGGSG